jgi:hypothetical protein
MEFSPLLIPILAILMGPIMYMLHLKEVRIKRSHELEDKGSAGQAARVTELEQRVRVLERILTDGGVQTAAQIEALRDAPVELRTPEKVL